MNVSRIDPLDARSGELGPFPALDQRFPARWSPRAMSGGPLSEEVIGTLLEAARWAPSCFNAQPWRFAWARNGDAAWPGFLEVLVDGNRAWAQHAGVLIAVAARRVYEHNGEPAPTSQFDAGAAWMSLALQASHMGLVSHGMRGFHLEPARRMLELPEHYDLCAMVAVGHPGDVEALPESVRERERPSSRKPLQDIAFAGGFQLLERNA